MPLVCIRDTFADGSERERVDWAQSPPDRVSFGVPMYQVDGRFRDKAQRLGGLVTVRDDHFLFTTWMAPPCWRTYALQVIALLNPIPWNVLHALWTVGMWEAPSTHERGVGRFSPFPWRGQKRRRANA